MAMAADFAATCGNDMEKSRDVFSSAWSDMARIMTKGMLLIEQTMAMEALSMSTQSASNVSHNHSFWGEFFIA